MKITKTIDVSHLTDADVELLYSVDEIQKKITNAKDLVRGTIKLLRGANDHQFLRMSPTEMADEIEKIAKAKGLL